MSITSLTKKKNVDKQKNSKLLNAIPFENGFHFFTDHGKYTGITAISLVEFVEKLQIVPLQSVNFHFQRQDFQNWIKNTIGDKELAARIAGIKSVQDEELRKQLSETVQSRIASIEVKEPIET